jgi:hypothetical protein
MWGWAGAYVESAAFGGEDEGDGEHGGATSLDARIDGLQSANRGCHALQKLRRRRTDHHRRHFLSQTEPNQRD